MRTVLKGSPQSELYFSVITKITDSAESLLHTFQERVDWFTIATKIFSQLAETSGQCLCLDKNAHPQLQSGASNTFSMFSNSSHQVSNFMNEFCVGKAIPAIESFAKHIKQARKFFKGYGNRLESVYYDYYNQVTAPRKICSAQEDATNGFNMHVLTLTYVRDIDSLENLILKSLEDFQGIVQHYQDFMASIQNDMSTLVILNFPFPIPQAKAISTVDINNQFREFRINIKEVIVEYRSPNISLPSDFVWSISSSQPKNFKLIRKQEGFGVLRIDEGEIVQVINADYGQLWKVRTAHGLEGFVSSLDLIPV